MYLNEYERSCIIRHVTELFFPQEVNEAVLASINTMLVDYISTAFSNMDPFVKGTDDKNVYLVPADGILSPIPLDLPRFRDGFGVPFIRETPELAYFSQNRRSDKKVFPLRVITEFCPISGFADTVEALYSFRREKKTLECLLATELRRSATTESFLKKHPDMKTVMSPWVENEILDLPLEANIDMTSIGFDAIGA